MGASIRRVVAGGLDYRTSGAIISDSQGTGTIVDNEGTLGSTLPNTATSGAGLGGSGAGLAIGLVMVSAAAALIRSGRRGVAQRR